MPQDLKLDSKNKPPKAAIIILSFYKELLGVTDLQGSKDINLNVKYPEDCFDEEYDDEEISSAADKTAEENESTELDLNALCTNLFGGYKSVLSFKDKRKKIYIPVDVLNFAVCSLDNIDTSKYIDGSLFPENKNAIIFYADFIGCEKIKHAGKNSITIESWNSGIKTTFSGVKIIFQTADNPTGLETILACCKDISSITYLKMAETEV